MQHTAQTQTQTFRAPSIASLVEAAAAPRLARQASKVAQNHELRGALEFLEGFGSELSRTFELEAPNPYLGMAAFLMRCHLDGRLVTPTSLIAASGVPYATANRKVKDMKTAGLIELRPRSRSGHSFSIHPSERLIATMGTLAVRIRQLANRHLASAEDASPLDVYVGDAYRQSAPIQPPATLAKPLALPGGVRILVHADPTFMVMDQLKRQFEQVIGTRINQHACTVDHLRVEALQNATRKLSRYDIIAVDLPWVGEFVEKGVLLPLDTVMDVGRLNARDFHPAGWRATHWRGRPYGAPSQTTPELLFHRKDLFAEAGLEPPASTDDVLRAAKILHRSGQGRYGIAWNAARGTALGHTFMMASADFGQPIVNMRASPGGFDPDSLEEGPVRATIDTQAGLAAAEYLCALMAFSPPAILSMSWYERVRLYAAGKVAMAYGYTSIAPYFELDPASPAHGQTGYLPHPSGCGRNPIAMVGGFVLGVPANLPVERRADAVEALITFTSAEAQKLYVLHGSRTAPRYSVGADPHVRRLSPIFDTVDALSWQGRLQYWPRPAIPQISHLIQICGEEFHEMLRGVVPPKVALRNAQARADALLATGTRN